MQFRIIFLSLFLALNVLSGQTTISANEVIEKSIQYHDPQGKLLNSDLVFNLIETRPNGPDRTTTLKFNISKERFTILETKDSLFIEKNYHKGEVDFKVNGSSKVPTKIVNNLRLTKQRFEMLRNYYQYLWLLPLKLKDEGSIIESTIKESDFFGKESLEVKVTYEPEVGEDIWYFYFHPKTYALIGYRFYHDESANDGEYILLEGEVVSDNVRLPKKRSWYMHKDDKFLGADILDLLSVD